jgi:hypothetical protein
MTKKRSFVRVLVGFFLLILVSPAWAMAQGLEAAPVFQPGELDQMLAPIAFYPDPLLLHLLMASTYPRDVVEATRWARANRNLQGDQLDLALQQQNWDPSVKSLVNFPQVLTMMSDKPGWTQRLADAMLSQPTDVMDAVQRLRKKAQGFAFLLELFLSQKKY